MPETLNLERRATQFLPTVADAYVRDNRTGELMFTAFANTDTNVEITMDQTDKNAGQGGGKLFTIPANRTINVTLTGIDFKLEYYAANIGSPVRFGKIAVISAKESHNTIDGKFTLDHTPIGDKIALETNSGFIDISVTGAEVDLSSYGIEEECVVVVYMYEADAKYVDLSATTLPLTAQLILETPLFNNKVGKVGSLQFIFNQFQFSGNISTSLTSSDSGTIELSGSPNASDTNTCNSDGSTYGQVVEVLADTADLYSVNEIYIRPNEIELSLAGGDTETLSVFGKKGSEAIYEAIQLTNGITYVSSTPATATVSSTGLVTPVAVGTTTITATYDGKTAEAEATIIT